jgi:hypothetical protein
MRSVTVRMTGLGLVNEMWVVDFEDRITFNVELLGMD